MSPAYPKFLLKINSEVMGGNVCISLIAMHTGMAVLAVTVFDITGEKCLDSFELALLETEFHKAIETASLVETVEKLYLYLQVDRKSALDPESVAAHVH